MSLLPLRVPVGFAICFNNFVDLDPIPCKTGDGFIENCEYFTEDILQIAMMKIVDGNWILPKSEKLIIDLGWYPDSRITGQYRLVQVNESWEVIREKYSKNRYEIRDTIEDWMKNPTVL
ncbi:hypothetical protein [Paenibacillus harenae]|uniref:hypothetical protein n=1 Tax=Paenibacillus harenae TaxID=306543 RepID=UPI00278C90BC|nr:hypothetical protein [Paenibacillus harenae]MDQ0063251.1 hypothetical protein [Paenibacillus harenae]